LAILKDTLEGMATAFPDIRKLATSSRLPAVARACEGLDGRSVRKLVAAACALDKHSALAPERLTVAQLLDAAGAASREAILVHDAGLRSGDGR